MFPENFLLLVSWNHISVCELLVLDKNTWNYTNNLNTVVLIRNTGYLRNEEKKSYETSTHRFTIKAISWPPEIK